MKFSTLLILITMLLSGCKSTDMAHKAPDRTEQSENKHETAEVCEPNIGSRLRKKC